MGRAGTADGSRAASGFGFWGTRGGENESDGAIKSGSMKRFKRMVNAAVPGEGIFICI